MANSPARSRIDVGSVIADTYTIEALIGQGGMGAVFVASHRRLPGKKVAIKVLHTDVEDEEVLHRFRHEAEIASRLGHPNIVGVSDFNITPDGTPYLVLEYLQGETLAQRIKQGPIPIDQALSIVRQVGSALAAAHREGIVHRDLKPQNIFLVPTEVDGRIIEIAKVLDFGISKIRGSQTVKTQDNSLLGTPQYMAPEQATGQHALVDERTDVFALGAIVYEMLCGHPAFNGASIPEVVFKVVYEQPRPLSEEAPNTPPDIVAAVQQAMAKPAEDRYATVNAFVEGLTGQPVTLFRGPAAAPPEVGFAAGSRISVNAPKINVASNDAYAQTMGSGDHGPAIGTKPAAQPRASAASLARPVTAPTAVDANAMTVDSQARSAPVAPPHRPSRKPIVLMVGLALVCVAAAGVAVGFAMKSPADPTRVAAISHDAAVVALVADAGVAVSPDVALTVDAAVIAVDAALAVADAKVARVDAAKVGTTTVKPAEPEDTEATQNLKDAESALASKNYPRAEQSANQVINAERKGGSDQLRHAYAVRGIVMCLHYVDEGRARGDGRAILQLGGGRWYSHMIKICHDHDQLLTDK